MSEIARWVLSIGGVVLTCLGLSAALSSGSKVTDLKQSFEEEQGEIRETMEKVREDVGRARDRFLAELKNQFAVTEASAAEETGDYPHYVRTKQAKRDMDEVLGHFASDDRFLDPSYALLIERIEFILRDYRNKIDEAPTLPRERVRIRGIVLSNRRQLGVYCEIVRNLRDAPREVRTLVLRVDEALTF